MVDGPTTMTPNIEHTQMHRRRWSFVIPVRGSYVLESHILRRRERRTAMICLDGPQQCTRMVT